MDSITERPLTECAALVTGASSGIGAATAVALAEQGASLALTARRTVRLENLAAEIRDRGGTCVVLSRDLSDSAQARRVVEETADRLGRLDVLVNNVGQLAVGNLEESDPDRWQPLVDLNFTSFLHTSRAALPHLFHAAVSGPRNVADVVNISSQAGRVTNPRLMVYSAAKHAVGAFSEALRQELTGRSVRVGLIEPGLTVTPMTTAEEFEPVARGIPRDTWLQADDVARSIVFMVTQPSYAAVNEILIRPTTQEF